MRANRSAVMRTSRASIIPSRETPSRTRANIVSSHSIAVAVPRSATTLHPDER
jgi:hypothetical protein